MDPPDLEATKAALIIANKLLQDDLIGVMICECDRLLKQYEKQMTGTITDPVRPDKNWVKTDAIEYGPPRRP